MSEMSEAKASEERWCHLLRAWGLMAIGRSLIVGVSGMWQGLDHLGRECRRAVKFREMDFRGISHVISIIEDCFLKKNWQIGHWG